MFKGEHLKGKTAYIPAAAHDVSAVLEGLDLVRRESDLSSPRDSLPLRDVCSHGRSLSGQQGFSVTTTYSITLTSHPLRDVRSQAAGLYRNYSKTV